MNHANLSTVHCEPQKGRQALDSEKCRHWLEELDGWTLGPDGKAISKTFSFADFRHTLGFINAVGFMANREDHHPDLEAGYGHCTLRWSTHDVDGLSMNDFICAARVDAMLR